MSLIHSLSQSSDDIFQWYTHQLDVPLLTSVSRKRRRALFFLMFFRRTDTATLNAMITTRKRPPITPAAIRGVLRIRIRRRKKKEGGKLEDHEEADEQAGNGKARGITSRGSASEMIRTKRRKWASTNTSNMSRSICLCGRSFENLFHLRFGIIFLISSIW